MDMKGYATSPWDSCQPTYPRHIFSRASLLVQELQAKYARELDTLEQAHNDMKGERPPVSFVCTPSPSIPFFRGRMVKRRTAKACKN